LTQQPTPGRPTGPPPQTPPPRSPERAGRPPQSDTPAEAETSAPADESTAPSTPVGDDPSVTPTTVNPEETLEAQRVSSDSESSTTHAHAAEANSASVAAAAETSAQPVAPSVTSPLQGPPTSQPAGAPPVIVPTPSGPNGAQVSESFPSTVARSTEAAADDIVYTPFALSIGDGFKFGCGVVLALFVTVMTLALLAAVGFLIASLAGFSIPIGALGK
jgi:hypothetical protein